MDASILVVDADVDAGAIVAVGSPASAPLQSSNRSEQIDLGSCHDCLGVLS
uniref:Uncharacterized protein n=1 Tax=Arundo donax TaxID=35708 RepID=A0A0A9C1A0_ARUDO